MAIRNLLCVCVVAGLLCASGGCVMQADYDEVKSKLQSVGAELQKTQDELGETKEGLATAQEDRKKALSDLANERESLTGQVRLAKAESAKLKIERDGLTKELQAARGDVDALQAAAKKNEQTQADLNTQLDKSRLGEKELRGKILFLEAKIKEQLQTIQQLEAKIKELQAKPVKIAP